MFVFANNSYASFSWSKIQSDVDAFKSAGGNNPPISVSTMTSELLPIGQTLATIGVTVLLAVAAIMGAKYMFASPEEQAKLKQQLIGLVVSAMVLFGAYNIWNLLRETFESILG